MIESKTNGIQSASAGVPHDPDTGRDVVGSDGAKMSGLIVASLALLPERALLDEQALASAFGVTKRTIRRMVARYELPPPVSFAGRATWQVRKVLSWFEERADRLAREAERASRRTSSTGL